MDGSENSKNVLANELKTKITQAAPEIASKYGDEKYRSTIDGYLNRQGSYQGSKEYVSGTIETNVLGALVNDKNLKSEIVNDGFFNKSLTETSYLGSEDNYTNQMEDGKYISELGIRKNHDAKDKSALKMDFEINYNAFGRILDDRGVWQGNSFYGGEDEKGRFTADTFSYYGEDGKWKGGAFSKEGFNQKTLNTAILRNESIKKAKATGEFNLLVESIGEATYIKQNTNLSKTFAEDYNKAKLGNYSMYSRVLFGVKKTDGTVAKLFNSDGNIGVLSRLKDYTVDNSNLISTEDIAGFKKWFKSLKDYDASIDWNFDKSAINLTDYKQNLNKVIAYNTKVDEILDIYQSIIDERKKSDPDNVKIANETKRLMALKDEVVSNVTDMSNYVAGITPTYNKQWADYYLNYGKAEADKVVARINNELKLYNDKDELVVDATTKAKEIQDNYDKAKKALDDKKAELDKVNKNINDLNLTTEEEKNDEVKRAKEAEKADREADKTRLEDEIKKGEDELAGLKEKLSKTSLKDLGLRSQAHGSGAFASGDDSIAMGTNATVTKADGIAIGQNTNVTGEKSIAIGKDSEVSGEKSIAIGVGHNVSGNHSTTIGDPNVVSGNDSFVAGNGNNVASNNVMVLGNNITVASGYDNAVVLGEGSTAEKANPTSSITIKDQTYNFAGTNPTSTVSVGKAGAERQIVNVAAGRISDTSTDAINGSQLYAAVEGIKNSSVNPEQVSDEVVNVLRTKLVAGDNININEDQATNTFTITGKGPKVVGGKNAKVEETKTDGVTTYTVNVEAEPVKLEEGDNVHVKTIENADGSKSYKLSADKTTVSSGTGISVETTNTTNDETGAVTTNYKVSLSEELSKQIAKEESVTAGSNNLTVTQNGTNETGGKNFVVDLAKSIDLTPEGSLKIGDVILNKDGLNNGGNKIINVANGTNPTDAVNLQQLNATKVEVVAGDKVNVETKTNEDGSKVYTVKALTSQVKGGNNVSVEETKDESGASVYTAKVEGDLTNITSISNGDTKLSLGDNIINANGARIGNIGAPTEANDATNKDYVDNSRNTVSSKDGTIKITSTTTNATTGAVNYDLSLNGIKGLASRTDDGVNTNYQLGDTMLISGDNKNISTVTDNGRIRVKLADDIKANSVTTGNVSISTKGVNAGGLKVTNVAPGEISETSTDAVNGSQLYRTNQQVINNAVNIGRLGDNVNQLNNRMGDVENRIGRVENRMDKLNKQRKAGHASGLATAGLLQAHRSGQSGVTAAVGQYQGATAVAVGYSRLSDNGKVGIKLSLTTNTQKEVGGTVGVGYFW